MLLALAGLLGGRAALAEPQLSLSWSAPPGCPSREDVLAETLRLLGGKLQGAAPPAPRAEIVLVGTADHVLRIVIDPASGERAREIHAPTCAELGEAAALILALSIDPIAVASAPPGAALAADPKAPPPPPAPAPLPPPAPWPLAGPGVPAVRDTPSSSWPLSPSPAPSPGAGTRPAAGAVPSSGGGATSFGPSSMPVWNTGRAFTEMAPLIPVPRFFAPVFAPPARPPIPPPAPATPPAALRAHGVFLAEAGMFRSLSPMLRAGLSFVPQPLRVEASLVLAWGGKIASATSTDKGGELWFGGGALTGCYEAGLGRGPRGALSLSGCLGVEGGVITAASYGVADPSTGQSPWIAPTAGAMFRWAPTRRLALRLDALLAVPLIHPRFRIAGLGTVHEPGPVGVRAGAGVEIDLFSK